jgi:hypothetical protein
LLVNPPEPPTNHSSGEPGEHGTTAIPEPGSDEELSDIPALLSTRIGLPLLGIAERGLTAKLVLFRSTARTPSFVAGR